MAKTPTKFTVGSNPPHPIYEVHTGSRLFFCVDQKDAAGAILPVDACIPFTSINTLKKHAYAGKIPGFSAIPAEYKKSEEAQARAASKPSLATPAPEPQRRAPRPAPSSSTADKSKGQYVYKAKDGEEIIMRPSPVGAHQPHYWIPPGTPLVRLESGHPVYRRTDDYDSRPIDQWTPPFTHYPKDVADAPLDPFFRATYLEPQAKARNMTPDAFILFLGRKYHQLVYPWKPQPLPADQLWPFLVEEAKRPELKRRTFSLFIFLLVDMEEERWWHAARPVPEPAGVALVAAQKAAEDFAA